MPRKIVLTKNNTVEVYSSAAAVVRSHPEMSQVTLNNYCFRLAKSGKPVEFNYCGYRVYRVEENKPLTIIEERAW